MWFFAAVIIILLSIYFFYRARQERPEKREEKTQEEIGPKARGQRRPASEMEASSDIGAPFEALNADKAGQMDRLSGVDRPRVRPQEDAVADKSPTPSSRQIYKSGDDIKRRVLRKDNLSKEVELAWEAGELIELQPGAWARHKDFPAMMEEIAKKKKARQKEIASMMPSQESSRKAQPEETPYSLMENYGFPRMVLLARDPEWVYVYWEMAHDKYRELYEKHIAEWNLSKPVIRLHDFGLGSASQEYMDVEINDQARNWYIKVSRPRHTIFAQLGRLFPSGFVPLLSSNRVTIPPDSVSDVFSEEWLPFDWEKYRDRIGQSSYGMWRIS